MLATVLVSMSVPVPVPVHLCACPIWRCCDDNVDANVSAGGGRCQPERASMGLLCSRWPHRRLRRRPYIRLHRQRKALLPAPRGHVRRHGAVRCAGKKRPLLEHCFFTQDNDRFTKTGSGQT